MKKIRIIIVENDEDEQFFMQEGFTASGLFQIIAMVGSGNELLEYLHEHPTERPDIILSDLNMPGKNGYDILTEMSTSAAPVPVIITSTSSAKSIMDKCMEMGAVDYLVKPETFNEYLAFAQNLYNLVIEKKLVPSSSPTPEV